MWPSVVHILSVPKANYSGPFTAYGPRSCFREGDGEYFGGICATLCPRGLAHPLGSASAQNKESRNKRGTDPALNNIFILYYEGFPVCIYIHRHMWLVSAEPRRGHRVPWKWNHWWLWAVTWALPKCSKLLSHLSSVLTQHFYPPTQHLHILMHWKTHQNPWSWRLTNFLQVRILSVLN